MKKSTYNFLVCVVMLVALAFGVWSMLESSDCDDRCFEARGELGKFVINFDGTTRCMCVASTELGGNND